MEISDDRARERVAELTELIDHQVVDAAPVDWSQVATWAKELAELATARTAASGGATS